MLSSQAPNCVMQNEYSMKSVLSFVQKIQVRTSWAMRNSTLPCFRLVRLLSSYHDTLSNRPSHTYMHAAPETMSHSCLYCSERMTCLSCVNVSGLCTDYTEYWALHCLRAILCCRATGNCCALPTCAQGLARPKVKEKSTGFLFWAMVFLLPVWVCLLLLRAGLDCTTGVASPGLARAQKRQKEIQKRPRTNIQTHQNIQKRDEQVPTYNTHTTDDANTHTKTMREIPIRPKMQTAKKFKSNTRRLFFDLHPEKACFSVYVDNIKIAGKKQDLKPMRKQTKSKADVEQPTPLQVYWGCRQ